MIDRKGWQGFQKANGEERDFFFLTHSPNIIQYSSSESSWDDSCWLSAEQNHLGDGPLLMLGQGRRGYLDCITLKRAPWVVLFPGILD